MNSKKIQLVLPVLFALTMSIGMFLGYKLRDKMPWNIQSTGSANDINEVLNLIKERYVDSIGTDSLSEDAIADILSTLDPHSAYIPGRELQEINEDLAGKFEGIGVEFNIIKDTVHVLNIVKGGPSEKAGVETGDRIIRVDDSLVAGNNITSDKIKSLLKGPGNSTVRVQFKRGSQLIEKTITRGYIPIFSMDASYMIDDTTGYIRLNKFSETTYEEFMEAMEKLHSQGIKKLILDLRDNGGGILDEAVQIADEFLSGEKLIVYTEGVHHPRREYNARRKGLFEDGKLVLLMDEGSASASEVLAGALQDWDRATIVGRRSFGKGLVQEQYVLHDGSALRLTVARYYTPLGRCIQKPYNNGIYDYNNDILNRYYHGELIHSDTLNYQKGKSFKTAGGKKLYGGGGITPDLFVAMDTTRIDTVFSKMYAKNTISNFSYQYYLDHLSLLKNFKNPLDYNKNFLVDDSVLADFRTFAKNDSIIIGKLDDDDLSYLSMRIKATIARQIWRMDGFFQVINFNDPSIEKAIKL